MRKTILRIFIALLILQSLHSFGQQENVTQHDTRMQWWRDARFGMFIHWGLYAVPAGEWKDKTGYGEWIRTSAQIPLETYNQFVNQFDPVDFDADEWVKTARDAGMKYIVITSKHHDGFCMFNTKQTDFCISSTPYKKDPMKKLAAACKKYGLKFCFYYSIMDWHHPDYLPRRNWETTRSIEGADFRKYADYMKAELKELLTNYGEIGVLWFDGEWESTWNETFGKEIYNYCRSIQPNIIINNRVGAGRLDMEGLTKQGMFGGDFGTPEQQIPATGLPGVDWETCMTMNDHWGYNKNDKNFKSSTDIVRMLVDISSKGGNYLLNVGPTAKGVFPSESVDRLKTIGTWMKVNSEAIYGTKASPFNAPAWGRCTWKEFPGGARLYLHVFDWPSDCTLVVPGCLNQVKKAFLLADLEKASLENSRKEDAILIKLPAKMPDTMNTVVVIDLIGKLDMANPPEIVADNNIFIDSLTVNLQSGRENTYILYTTDGSPPNLDSPIYTSPLRINRSTLVFARCYRDGNPVSGVVAKSFMKVEPFSPVIPIRQNQKIQHSRSGLSFKYYEGKWDSIPDFRQLIPVKQGYTTNFTLEPSLRKEFYAIQYEGLVLIPTTDVYKFFTATDDGSNLYIDDMLVVANDGPHATTEKNGSIPLASGFHKIRVEYFQQTGGADIQVSIQGGNMKKQAITGNMLFLE